MIDPPSSQARVVRFGSFELNVQSGELRKNGLRVGLQDQPLQVLTVLLERPRELVTREELRQRLWPADTYVDFEHGLNAAVKRLRDALGDSAETPRFVETVPRRGYRFAADVSKSGDMAGEPDRAGARTSAAVGRASWTRRRRLWAGIAAGVVAAATLGLYASRAGRSRPVGRIVPVTSTPGMEIEPALSTDGKQVAFIAKADASGNYDLFVTLVEGGDVLRLTDTPEDEESPSWSPDGTRIAFVRDLPTTGDEARRGVFVVSALGGGEQRVGFAAAAGLSWSPDGRALAIAGRSAGEPTGIWVVSVETGERRRVTQQSAEPAGDWWPTFSPDGHDIAFLSGAADAAVYVVPAAGGERRRLTPGASRAFGVAWAPDGRSLVYASSRGAGTRGRLFRVPISGGEPEALALGEEPASWPSLSQAGNRMVFSREVTDWNIWRVEGPNGHVATRGPARLIASTRSEWAPAYSPDGSRVAFTSDRTGGTPQIWICGADGGRPQQLTSLAEGAINPRWSAGGDRIAFHTRGFHLFEVSREGGPARALMSDDSFSVFPSWSVDGRWIYFDRDHNRNVWRIPVAGGAAEQITRDGGMQPVVSPDGKYVYYVKLSGRGVWRMSTAGGDEEKITDQGEWNRWDVFADGLCYVSTRAAPHAAIECLRFASNQVETILPLEKPTFNGGFSVSPDGGWILYTQVDTSESDLVLVEGFH